MNPGFYLYEEELLYAPNFVHAPDYSLTKEQKDNYSYPNNGWYWFDSEEEAIAFFNLPPLE